MDAQVKNGDSKSSMNFATSDVENGRLNGKYKASDEII